MLRAPFVPSVLLHQHVHMYHSCPLPNRHSWACIDPAVFIDDDGQAYLTWGNRECYIVKLKDNMIETEGEVKRIHIDESHPFTEAPWIHKYNGKYYLTYASEWPEKIAYAVADTLKARMKRKG